MRSLAIHSFLSRWDRSNILFFSILLICLLGPVLVIVSLIYSQVREETKNSYVSERQNNIDILGVLLGERIEKIRDIGISLATSPVVVKNIKEDKWEEALSAVVDVKKVAASIKRILLVDTTSKIMADTEKLDNAIGTSRGETDWYKGVSRTWEPYVSEVVYRFAIPRVNVVNVVIPVLSGSSLDGDRTGPLKDGERVIGLIVLQLMLEQFSDIAQSAYKRFDEGELLVVDQNGHLIYSSIRKMTGVLIDLSSDRYVSQVMKEIKGSSSGSLKKRIGSDLVLAQKVKKYNWHIILIEPFANIEAMLDQRIHMFYCLIFGGMVVYVLMVLVVMILLFVTRRSNRLLNTERENLQKIFDVVQVGLILVGEKCEVRRFNRALENMIHRPLILSKGLRIGEILCGVKSADLDSPCGEAPRCVDCRINSIIVQTLKSGTISQRHEVCKDIMVDSQIQERWFLVQAAPMDMGSEQQVLLSLIDISESKETERVVRLAQEQVLKSEAWWRSLIQEVPAVAFVLEKEGVVRSVNRSFAGIAVEELVGNPVDRFLDVKQGEAWVQGLKAVFENKESVIFESSVRTSLGDVVWYENHIGPIEAEKEYVGALCLSFDITQRKHSESLLLKMSLAVKYSPVAVVITDRRGRVEYVNARFTASTGYRMDEVNGQVLRILREGELSDDRRQDLLKKVYSGQEWKGEFVERTKEGVELFEMVTVSPVMDTTEKVTHFIVLKEDITEHYLLQKQKEKDLLFLKGFLDAIPNPVFYKNRAGVYLSCNRSFEEYYGKSRAEIIGRTVYDIAPKAMADVYHAHDEKAFLEGTGSSYEAKVRYCDGTDHDVMFFKSILHDQEGKISGLVGVMLDITERKGMEEDLRNSEEQLMKALEEVKSFNMQLENTQDMLVQQEKLAAIGFLAAGVAHEINNPLGFVNGNLQSLGEYSNALIEAVGLIIPVFEAVDSGDMGRISQAKEKLAEVWEKRSVDYILKDIKGLLAESQEGIDRIKTIVLGLKNFSRTDGGEMVMTNINELIDSMVTIVWSELKYHVELIREYGSIPLIPCNSQQLGQVFVNLLVNASQAIKEHGVITLRTFFRDGGLVVEVKDTGCGIPEAIRTKIFDPFFTTKEPGKGTGLGLSISYDIVKKHGGHIDVQSRIGEGTTFSVIIPVRQTEPIQKRGEGMIKKALCLGIMGVCLAAGAAFAEEVRIGAGAAATENIFKKIQAPFEQATGVTLFIESSGPIDGFKKMDAGGLAAVVAGVEFNEWIAMLEKDGYKVADKAAYVQQVIGKDIIKVIVNKEIAVASLSKEQLKGVFTGKITNWSELGGLDMEIGVIFAEQIQGTQNMVKKVVMDGEEYTGDRIEVATADDVKKKVVETPGSIGLVPQSLADEAVTVPAIPEIGRTIILATKGVPNPAVQKVLDYIKGDGQALIK